MITYGPTDLAKRTFDGVVVVFEVLSPSSGRVDRIIKVREYAAVSSIRRYVILEYTGAGMTVLSRSGPDVAWTAATLTDGDALALPETGIEIPVAEIYTGLFVPPET
jgi:Uma2 family endonuclease